MCELVMVDLCDTSMINRLELGTVQDLLTLHGHDRKDLRKPRHALQTFVTRRQFRR